MFLSLEQKTQSWSISKLHQEERQTWIKTLLWMLQPSPWWTRVEQLEQEKGDTRIISRWGREIVVESTKVLILSRQEIQSSRKSTNYARLRSDSELLRWSASIVRTRSKPSSASWKVTWKYKIKRMNMKSRGSRKSVATTIARSEGPRITTPTVWVKTIPLRPETKTISRKGNRGGSTLRRKTRVASGTSRSRRKK